MSGLAVKLIADGSLLHLSLDLGKGNILDLVAIAELSEAVAEASSNESLKAILLDHTGKNFSFGASIEDHLPDRVGEMLPRFHALARDLLALDVPVLAVVRGQCLGGGLELALLADRLFSSPTAHFGQPEIRLAVFAPVASALLPHRIGRHAATDLLLSGRSVPATEALEIGLIDRIAADPFAEALEWAQQHLLPKSSAALRLATRAARSSWTTHFATNLERLERLYLDELMATHDAVEGIEAFLERREAVFENR